MICQQREPVDYQELTKGFLDLPKILQLVDYQLVGSVYRFLPVFPSLPDIRTHQLMF